MPTVWILLGFSFGTYKKKTKGGTEPLILNVRESSKGFISCTTMKMKTPIYPRIEHECNLTRSRQHLSTIKQREPSFLWFREPSLVVLNSSVMKTEQVSFNADIF